MFGSTLLASTSYRVSLQSPSFSCKQSLHQFFDSQMLVYPFFSRALLTINSQWYLKCYDSSAVSGVRKLDSFVASIRPFALKYASLPALIIEVLVYLFPVTLECSLLE